LDLENQSALDPSTRQFVGEKNSRAGRIGAGGPQIIVSEHFVRLSLFSGIESAVSPSLQRVANAQTFGVALKQLKAGHVFLCGHIRERIHMELKVKGVAGSIVAMN
jgi:hypothetical protein